MKRLSTLFLALALIAFAGTSCKKNLEGNFNPKKKISSVTVSQDGYEARKTTYKWNNNLLVEETLSTDGNNYILQYSYDDKKRISEVKCTSENVLYKYIYNGDKLVKIEGYYNSVLGTTYDFIHANGKTPYVIEIVLKVFNESYAKKFNASPINPLFFLPNEIANNISKAIRNTKDQTEISYTLIYDNNKNISEIRSQSIVYEFKYDNKCNPFSGFYNAFDSEIDYFSMQYDRTFNFINRNNIVECTMSVPSSSGQIAPVIIKYEYNYSNDYPTTQIITDEHNGTIVKTTYTYL